MGKPPEVPLKKRWLLYSGAWGAASLGGFFIIPLLLSVVRDRKIPSPDQLFYMICSLLVFSPMFPIGLAAWFHDMSGQGRGTILSVAGLWLAYLVHGIFTLRSRTRVRFYSLLAILAIALAFNVVGCQTLDIKLGRMVP
jgi:hypothetical protein